MGTEADILKALEGLYGPGGTPLAHAVSGINLSGAKVFVSLSGDPGQAQAWESARIAAERAIKSS
ncbi:MAG: iron-sulfur cluster assembly protein, partial [Alphaproteobacteria bacterium]|nr:iron-sulfur cluster assembly protein [Alphaproteobacteria bacterium]